MVNKKGLEQDLESIIEKCNEHLENLKAGKFSDEEITGWPAHFSQVLQDVSFPDL